MYVMLCLCMVWMRLCTLWMYYVNVCACATLWMYFDYVCMHVFVQCVYVLYVCIECLYAYIYKLVCIYICMWVTHACMYVCVYMISMCVRWCVNVYSCILFVFCSIMRVGMYVMLCHGVYGVCKLCMYVVGAMLCYVCMDFNSVCY